MRTTTSPTEESIRQGMKEALAGETLPVSELWKGIDTLILPPTRNPKSLSS